ncbi:MAG: hypothetical protein KAT66_09065 [Candidatus Lokiarchaeota archaeon]|nr:hypothetical protein [Candidatus Lokiarchaeota archaeon]
MIFQLIMRDADWYWYLINAFIVIIGRLLDILSTRYVSKELKLETNKLARRIGWRGIVLMQIPIIVLGSLDIYLAFFIFIWSLFLFANNIMGSWNTKQIGEEQYYEDLKSRLKQTKRWQIILSEISYLLTFTLTGIFVLVFLLVFNDIIAVFFLSLALICQGLLTTVRSMKYLFDLKKESQKNNEN